MRRPAHSPNQMDAPGNPPSARAETETCAESSGNGLGRCGCRSRRSERGAVLARERAESRAPTRAANFDAARHPTEGRPTVPGAGHHPSNARSTVASFAAGVRSTPTRHHPRVGRSLPGDSLLDPARSRPFHRGGRRGAPCPRWRARAGDSIGARGQPRPGTQGEGRRRSLPRPTPEDAATDADEHGLRAAQLPEAPPRPRVRRSAKLGAAFFGVESHSGGHGCSAGHGYTQHLDGACRLAARGRAVAGRRTAGRAAATAQLESADVEASGRPNLNRRMLRGAGGPT